jgi:hypothetical protein
MRILLVSPYFPPQQAVASLRAYSFACTWAQQGAAVTVLTTAKRANQRAMPMDAVGFSVVEIPYRGWWFVERMRDRHAEAQHVTAESVTQCPGPSRLTRLRTKRGIFASVRMPDLTDAWVTPAVGWVMTQSETWDCVVSTAGPYTAHLVARQVKRHQRASIWIGDYRDLWTDNHLFRGVFPFTVRERVLERRGLREMDAITTVSQGLAHQLTARTDTPVHVIHNGYDPPPETDQSRDFDAMKSDAPLRIVYTGTLYTIGQDPSPMLRAITQLDGCVHLHVAGPDAAAWQQLARQCSASDFLTVHGMVSHAEARRLQVTADALLLCDWGHADQGILTAKVFEYLPAHAPILAVGPHANSEAADLLRSTGRGMHLGNEVAQIASALQSLCEHRDAPQAQRNDELIATFSRTHQAQRFFDLIVQRTGA